VKAHPDVHERTRLHPLATPRGYHYLAQRVLLVHYRGLQTLSTWRASKMLQNRHLVMPGCSSIPEMSK